MTWDPEGGRPGNPWGQRPHQQPPEVDKVIQMAREALGNRFLGNRGAWPVLGVVILLLWMATGIYVVSPDEEGVVLRFGKFVRVTGPGPHYHLPIPVEQVLKPKTTAVQRIELGYRTRDRGMVDVPEESLMLTGDENIIDINFSVQFRIKDAADYLFNVRDSSQDPHGVVRSAAEAAIRQVIGRNSIDEALTTGKDRIQADTSKTLQEILDSYKAGIHIVAVQLQQVQAPDEVIHAFKDVASAREDRERAINEAQGYANDILPKAKGEAARLIQEAEAYKASKVARAKGDVTRFLSQLEEYSKARDVTRSRLYLETMEEVLSGVNKVVVDPGAAQGVLPYLPLPGATPRPPQERTETGGQR